MSLTQKQAALQRLGSLKGERYTWWQHWKEISDYFAPHDARFFQQDRNKGWKRHNAIYDNTGPGSLRVLSAGLMAGLTSPARPWFRLAVADDDMMRNAHVKIWLRDVTNLLLNVFAKSNTYRALHTIYKGLGSFGTAGSLVSENFDNVIHHHTLTTGEYMIQQDWQGRVCTLYREFEKTVGELVKEFGLENCSGTVQNMYNSGQLDLWIPVVHQIEPREDREPGKRDAKNMAWKSVYWELGGDKDRPLREGGYKDFPAICPRWDLAGGDVYGNSPAMEALGDAKQLQQEQLRKGQAIDYQTKPPIQVPNALKNREIDTLPGGVVYSDMAGATGKIQTLWDVNLNLQFLLADINDVRERIRSAFYVDMFLMISNSGSDARMTATEVAERHEEKMLMIGPVLERLTNEALEPLINTTFDRCMAAGLIPPPPQEMHGMQLNVELVSILAQAQRAIATNGVDRFVSNLGQIAQFKPDVLDKFDSDHWADAYSDMLGVDPEMIVASDQVAIIRQQRAQAQAAAQKQEQMNQMADTAQKLGNTPTGGAPNAANDLMQSLTGYSG